MVTLNTSTLKQKLLLTYAHKGVEEAERLAQRDVERTQAYKDSLKYNLDWIKEQAKETLLDFFAFERLYKHSLQGLSRSTIIDKYIKTYTRGVTA